MATDTVPTDVDEAPKVGTRTLTIRGTHFEVDERYEVQKYLGSGSYGVVVSARTPDGTPVAIKKIANVFKNDTTAKRTTREVLLMMHLRHENVISISDLTAAAPPNSAGTTDLYVVTELMDTDLHKVIRSPQPLTDQHVQYFVYQLLRGLKYIHSANVLHRDLKPSNLLVNENCDLKITDFGLARGLAPSAGAAGAPGSEPDFLTEYVVTRWYRAPEVVLSSGAYAKAIDVWSCGCILAELLVRKPLFPGNDHVGQLNCILDLLGTPTAEECSHLPDKARRYILALPPKPPRPLAEVFPGATAPALDLLASLLRFDPRRRCTVEEALAHPYLATFHNPALEPSAPALFNFELERQEPAELLWAALCEFRPHLAAASGAAAANAAADEDDASAGGAQPPAGAPRRAGSRGAALAAESTALHNRPRYQPPATAGAREPPPAPPETMLSR
ncbi:hypothetical protein KFE25_013163 [Diacronema lutheri]|uniref:Mitogen-activated protein kinase n=2 Tax=Diacronema lutheri TaxID=2081491 RepID=A0A8J5XBH8_DIALT|nr:hypothetical protein KFE25_013163 [Diacronema lutheri]